MAAPASFPEALFSRGASADGARIFARVWSQTRGVEQELSYAAFSELVRRGATCFLDSGVRAGDRVAFLCKGTLDFYVGVVAAQAVGATPVLLNWRQPLHALQGMLADSGSSVLVVGDPYGSLGDSLAESARTTIALGPRPKGRASKAFDYASCAPAAASSLPTLLASGESAVYFTSGSTSRPKPVLHLNETLVWTATHLPFPAGATSTLCFMPNFHVLMSFQSFLCCLYRGVGCSIHGADDTDTVTSALMLAAARDLAPSTIDTVPFIMADWSDLDDLSVLAKCAVVRSGGAPLPPAVARKLVAGGVTVKTHFGQTEAPGMQLLTAPGAAPDELAFFASAWPADAGVVLELSGGGDEGELCLVNCKGSSPGYLKDGVLDPSSSKRDAHGRHRTGDVFRRAPLKGGGSAIQHVMRVDDTILLSTGEMFNPVPIEAAMVEFCKKQHIAISNVVVLGANRPRPFLVVQLKEDDTRNCEEAKLALQPGVDAVNADQVAYAKIEHGYTLVLSAASGDESLPCSAKGNVQRSKAEAQLEARLTALAESAAESAVDWDAIEAQALAEGFDDVDEYTAARGLAEIGVDSLGVVAAMNRGQRNAERVGDNVKAWMMACVIMTHWYKPGYFPGGPNLYLFYYASVGGGYGALAWPVQFVVNVACFIADMAEADGATASMVALVFSVGWADGVRDGSKREVRAPFTNARDGTMVILIVFYKLMVFMANTYSSKNAYIPDCLAYSTPENVIWYLYSLLYYRCMSYALQKCRVPNPAIVAVSWGVYFLFFLQCPICEYDGSWILPEWLNALITDALWPQVAVVVRGTLDDDTVTYMPESGTRLVVAYQDVVYPTEGFGWSSPKCWIFFFPWTLGYFYGAPIMAFAKKYCKNVYWNVIAAFALQTWLLVSLMSWVQDDHVFTLRWRGLKPGEIADGTDWNWQVGHPGHPKVLANWKPMWARPFYQLYDYGFNALTAFFVVAACQAVSWRAVRCGNAALGKYFFMLLQPTVMFYWVCWLVSLMGRGPVAHSNFLIQVLQITVLLGWPYVYIYTFGPLETAVILAVPRFVRWALAAPFHGWDRAVEDVLHFRDTTPTDFKNWWANYFSEIKRDRSALHAWMAETAHWAAQCLAQATAAASKPRETADSAMAYLWTKADDEDVEPLLPTTAAACATSRAA